MASCPGPSPLTRGKPQLLADGLVQARLIPAHAGKTTCRRASSVATSAHPRSRGENPILAHDGGRLDGSSPLTRGKRDLPLSESLAEGLIPAHAGKTSGRPSPTGAAAAHPRSRGENANSGRPAVSFAGSSPLTRGKRADDALRLSNPGLIPAHAGKTLRSGSLIGRTTAHPRSRGENHWMPHPIDPSRGSSPLTRGKLLNSIPHAVRHRLIPAHAGKTRPRGGARLARGAHPRSRGENVELSRVPIRDYGSSPLTRGKRIVIKHSCNKCGLIPAHAGKTSLYGPLDVSRQAHPRSRGENRTTPWPWWPRNGSSPLTRGKRRAPVPAGTPTGLIPAHAGKTGSYPGRAGHPAAHPRSRGENLNLPGRPSLRSGSSPLTRGKLSTIGGASS